MTSGITRNEQYRHTIDSLLEYQQISVPLISVGVVIGCKR